MESFVNLSKDGISLKLQSCNFRFFSLFKLNKEGNISIGHPITSKDSRLLAKPNVSGSSTCIKKKRDE